MCRVSQCVDLCQRSPAPPPTQSPLPGLVCTTWLFAKSSEGIKASTSACPYIDANTHDCREWQWLLFTTPHPPNSLSCCVSLPTNVSATTGQWLILVCLTKCLKDACSGCLFPPLAHSCSPVVSWNYELQEASPHLLLPWRCHSLPLFWWGWHIIVERQKATWTDRDLLFWPEPLFVTTPLLQLPHTLIWYPPNQCAVCLVCAGGIW